MHRLAIIAGLFVSACCLFPRKSVAGEEAQALLWRVEHPTLQYPSFLFGTIHLICPEDYFWTERMDSALGMCEEVCFEMDMDDPGLLSAIAVGMLDNSGKVLEDYFTPEEYGVLKAFMTDSLGVQIDMFQRLKPAALQTLFAASTAPCETPVSYELKIMEIAKERNVSITGLESPQEQLDVLNSLQDETVLEELIRSIKDRKEAHQEYRELLGAYKRQDLDLLSRLLEASKLSDEEKDVFLYTRNRKWVSRIQDKMEQRPVFFAVGAAHLGGEKGLIQLLRAEGYVVKPVL